MATVEPSFFPFLALPEELRQRVYYWHIVRVMDNLDENDAVGENRDSLLTVCKVVSEGYLSVLRRDTRIMLGYDFRVFEPHELVDMTRCDLDDQCRALSSQLSSLTIVALFAEWKEHWHAGEINY